MALPTVAIKSSTGSDTAASGAGPATALSGTAASTAASTTVTLLTDNPDLSGVATDGSAVLWVGSSSGRQFSKITNKNNTAGVKTVTVETAFTNTESGKNWGIGGKRATLAGSTQLGIDMRGGWTIDVQDDQVLTANFRIAPTNVTTVWSTITSTTTVRPVISTATNSVFGLDVQGANNLVVSHLSFLCTAGTKGNGLGLASTTAASYVNVSDCVFDGWAVGILDHDNGGNSDVNGMVIEGCEVKNCTGAGIALWAGAELIECYVHNNTGNGFTGTGTRARAFNLIHCVFDSNGGDQVNITNGGQSSVTAKNCVFSNAPSGKDGLSVNTTSAPTSLNLTNNIFYSNARNGILAAGGNIVAPVLQNNAFGANGINLSASGVLTSTGSGAITLTANPFVSSSDFGLNSTAGGGALCKGVATTIPNASANPASDVGAVPTGGGAAAAGGGSKLAGNGGGLAG